MISHRNSRFFFLFSFFLCTYKQNDATLISSCFSPKREIRVGVLKVQAGGSTTLPKKRRDISTYEVSAPFGRVHGRELAGTVMYLERKFQTSCMEAEVPVPRQQLVPSPLVQSRPAARAKKKNEEMVSYRLVPGSREVPGSLGFRCKTTNDPSHADRALEM